MLWIMMVEDTGTFMQSSFWTAWWSQVLFSWHLCLRCSEVNLLDCSTNCWVFISPFSVVSPQDIELLYAMLEATGSQSQLQHPHSGPEVAIRGLRNHVELNGCIAKVSECHEESQRYEALKRAGRGWLKGIWFNWIYYFYRVERREWHLILMGLQLQVGGWLRTWHASCGGGFTWHFPSRPSCWGLEFPDPGNSL